jgi:hypothetical protein
MFVLWRLCSLPSSLQVHLEYHSKGDQYGNVHPPASVSRNPSLRTLAP